MSLSGHQSARMKNDEWLTPPEILSALGTFDLDPCSPVNRPWPTAAQHYTERDNGLALPWHGRVLLTISEDDIISSCPSDCHKHLSNNAQNAEWSNLFPLSISVPVPVDHSAFSHVAGSAWHKPTRNESADPGSSAPVNGDSTQSRGCRDAQNAEPRTLQPSNTSGQSRDAATDSLLGAANAQEQKRETVGQRSGSPSTVSRKSKKSGSDTSNPNEERKPNRQAPESITPSDASVWGAADGVLFIRGRPHFHYVDGTRARFNSGAPIALVAYGRENLDALCNSGLGFVVVGHNT